MIRDKDFLLKKAAQFGIIQEAVSLTRQSSFGQTDEPIVDFQFPEDAEDYPKGFDAQKEHRIREYMDARSTGGLPLVLPRKAYKKIIMIDQVPIELYFAYNRPSYVDSSKAVDEMDTPIEKILYYLKENPYHNNVRRLMDKAAQLFRKTIKDKIDVVIPLPTSGKEGTDKAYFNDAFSRIMADAFNTSKIASGLLKKRKGFVAHKVELKSQRGDKTRENIGITQPKSGKEFFEGEKLNILLVDDIVTNGYTFKAAAEKIVRRYGDSVNKIYAVSLIGKMKLTGSEKDEFDQAEPR